MGKKYTKKLQDALITNEFFGQSAESSCPYGCCKVRGHRAAGAKPNPFPTLDHDTVGAAALVRVFRARFSSDSLLASQLKRKSLGFAISKRMKTILRE